MNPMLNALFSLPWFFLPEVPEVGAAAALPGEEARHAGGSRRLRPGDQLGLFDGTGLLARGTLRSAARGRIDAQIEIIERHVIDPPTPAIHLAAALPKGDRQAVMLGMATQWGAASFTPLRCRRSVVEPGKGFERRAVHLCLEACKQCRRPHVPAIRTEVEPLELTRGSLRTGSTVLLAHPCDRPLRDAWPMQPAPPSVAVLIGPEGGFADDEAEALERAGAIMVSLGDTLLRMETAAVSALAWLRLALP